MTASNPPTLYKILNADGSAAHGGAGKWNLPHGKRPGRWMKPVAGPLAMCQNGYHFVEAATITEWLLNGARIFVAEPRGGQIGPEHGKWCCESARLLRELPVSDRVLRLLACDCAERALGLIKSPDPRSINAIKVARCFANGEATVEELAAAWAAARDAAWDAAWAAARAAARDAAWDATWDATWDAECRWQGKRLIWYLEGEREAG